MKFSIFTLLFFCLPLYGNPFYIDPPEQAPYQQAAESPQNFAKNLVKQPACVLPENLRKLDLGVDFATLKLVGILQIKGKFRALFQSEQRLIDLYTDDLVLPDYIQLTEISFKGIQYIDWTNAQNCDKNSPISMKF